MFLIQNRVINEIDQDLAVLDVKSFSSWRELMNNKNLKK